MSFKYLFGALVSLPLLPILFVQGKKIKKTTPRLLEAQHPEGFIDKNSKEKLSIIAIGESTIAGVGVDFHKDGFMGTLAKEIALQKQTSVSWKVYAKSGYTAKLVRERLLSKIKESKVNLIIIGLGGNDAFTLNSPKKWNKEMNLLIQTLNKKFPETPIYFTNMPPIKEFPAFTKTIKFVVGNLVEILGKCLNKEVNKYPNVYYNNEVITLKGWQKKFKIEGEVSSFFSDGVHPSKITYQVWAKDMAQFILNTKTF